MIKIKDKKKFIIFLIISFCFILSGVYLVFELVNLNKNKIEKITENKYYEDGISKLSEGDFDLASESLEKAVAEDNNPEKIKMLAISQYNQKKYEEAENNFKRLVEDDKVNEFFYYNSLANIYRDQKKYEEAVEYYEKSLENNPQFETAYQNLAILYLYEITPRNNEKAQEVIERGLKNIPESEVLKKMKE